MKLVRSSLNWTEFQFSVAKTNPKQLQSQASKFIQRDLQANKCAQNRKQKDLFSFVFFI